MLVKVSSTKIAISYMETNYILNLQKNGKYVMTMKVNNHEISKITRLSNNQIASERCYTSPIDIWDIRTGICLRSINYGVRIFNITTISNNRIAGVVSFKDNFPIDIWDVSSGKKLKSLIGHNNIPHDILQINNAQLL